ncbi:MAG TPA: YCF48-related protein [Conexibacter sp.]|nr:YCF48-related protein [Conexibacter sp.]
MSIRTALAAALTAALLALAAAAAGASVQVGSSGWQWGNPLPQGNTVRAMSFAGATGYAAGDFGTLLKTTDGGNNWSGLPVGTFQSLAVVQALDVNTVVAGGGCVARRSTDGGATFSAIRFTPVESNCRVGLRDLSFVSADVGYVLLADGSVFTTTDGGTQFAPRTAVPESRAAGGTAEPGGIAFLDARTGYATSGTKIFQTLDGGVSWRGVGSNGWQLNRLSFVDAQHGFAVGYGGTFLRTDDGGNTWSPRVVASNGQALTSIACNSSRICILTTGTGTELIRTGEYGDTGGTVVTPSTDPVFAAGFGSPQRVVAAGQNGATVVSDDTGVRFTPVGGRIGGTFRALRAGGDANTAYAPGADGALAKTTDGGRTWSTGNVPTTADLLDVSFPTATDGYALDVDGGLFHTTTGGTAWEGLNTGSTRRPRAVLAPDASTVLVIGPRGLRRSEDSGQTFDQVRARAVLRAQLTGIATAHADGTLFVWGPSTVARSDDGGATWIAVPKPGRTARERRSLSTAQVAFASTTVGLLRDSAGRIWRTTNAGHRWTLLTSVGTENVVGMTASSTRKATLIVGGFGSQSGGYLLRSVDAGVTWQPQFVVSTPIQPDGLAAGDSVDYLLAGTSGLLFSSTGGVVGSASRLTVATRRRVLTKPGRITVTGQLQPAGSRAQVVVSAIGPGGTTWSHQTVAVASNGTFATAWSVRRGTSTFVAQWTGDFKSAGAGSRPMTVTVSAKKPKPKHRRARRRAQR